MYLGKDVLSGISPLVESVKGSDSVALKGAISRRDRTVGVEGDLRKTERPVRIVGKVFVNPARSIHASFVDQCGAKGMIPNPRHSAVSNLRVEKVHQAITVSVDT